MSVGIRKEILIGLVLTFLTHWLMRESYLVLRICHAGVFIPSELLFQAIKGCGAG
jgi:hypothetical protein